MSLIYWKCRDCGVYLPDEKLARDHHKYWKHGQKPKNYSNSEEEIRDGWERVEFREVEVTLKSLLELSEEEEDLQEDFEVEELQTSEEHSDFKGKSAKDKGPFACNLCPLRTRYPRNLLRHLRRVHGINKKVKKPPGMKLCCQSCPFSTKSPLVLARHVKKFHLQEEDEGLLENVLFAKQEFQCYDCPSKFPSQKKLYSHRKKDHRETHECPHCPNVAYRCKSVLKIHMLRHSDSWEVLKKDPKLLEAEKRKIINERKRFRMKMYNKPLNYKCPHCPRAFNANLRLQYHIGSHTAERPFKCTICEASYKVQYDLVNHIKLEKCEKVIAKAATKLLSCELCLVRLKHKNSLKNHMRTVHGIRNVIKPLMPVTCPICAYRTAACNLERHMKIHTGEKDFSCEACGHLFTFKNNMIRHIQFGCDLAKKSGLAAKYALLKKRKSKSTSSKKYKSHAVKCFECNAHFANTGKLQGHQAIHGTAFKCPHCPAGYQKKIGLSFHLKRSHPETVTGEECEFCGKKFGTWSRMRVHCQHVHGVEIPKMEPQSRRRSARRSKKEGSSENEEDFLELDDSVDGKLEVELENDDREFESIHEETEGERRQLLEDKNETEDFCEEDSSIEVIVVTMEEVMAEIGLSMT